MSIRRLAMSAAALALPVVLSAGGKQAQPQATPVAGACVADSVGTLRDVAKIPACRPEDPACRGKCQSGDAAACLAMAYALEKNSATADEASGLYRRGCLLGAANACTNYAGTLWAGAPSDDVLECPRRIFEKACSAKDSFACGMLGRLMLEATTPPRFAEGRRYLETACDELGGFSCRVLAKQLESGKLGAYRPELIRSLLKRACAGGDPDGCGEPATAAETFH